MNIKRILLFFLIFGVIAFIIFFTNGIPGITSNELAVHQDLNAAAERAQTLWARPALMDGAGRDFSIFEEADLLARLNISSGSSYQPGVDYQLVNKNGTYSVEIHNESSISITGSPAGRSEDVVIRLTRNAENDGWDLFLNGELAEPTE